MKGEEMAVVSVTPPNQEVGLERDVKSLIKESQWDYVVSSLRLGTLSSTFIGKAKRILEIYDN